MKESAADKLSRAYRMGADDAQKQARQELDRLRELNCRCAWCRENAEQRQETEELRDLVDNQARIIESMQKQINKVEV